MLSEHKTDDEVHVLSGEKTDVEVKALSEHKTDDEVHVLSGEKTDVVVHVLSPQVHAEHDGGAAGRLEPTAVVA